LKLGSSKAKSPKNKLELYIIANETKTNYSKRI